MNIDFNLINWENWVVDKDYTGKSKDGEYWDITEVLYCKLDWIKERLEEDNQYNSEEDDNSEFVEALEIVQKILEKLDEEKLKKL